MDTIYSQMADVIRTKGWVQDYYQNWQGVCLMGAGYHLLRQKARSLSNQRNVEESNRFHDAMMELGLHLGVSVIDWNDKPGRTKEQVLDLLQEMHENKEKELAEKGEMV